MPSPDILHSHSNASATDPPLYKSTSHPISPFFFRLALAVPQPDPDFASDDVRLGVGVGVEDSDGLKLDPRVESRLLKLKGLFLMLPVSGISFSLLGEAIGVTFRFLAPLL